MNSKINTLTLLLYLISGSYSVAKEAPWVGLTIGNALPCQGSSKGYGPYDFFSVDKHHVNVVEQFHFTRNVEQLIKGESSRIVDDLDYTLVSIPNHPKALLSAIRFQIKENNKLNRVALGRLKSTPECYLQRAINFNPKNTSSYILLAYYYSKINKLKKAQDIYIKAINLAPNNSKTEYLYSLLLIKLKENKEAVKYAKKAYQHGHPPQNLKNKLKKLHLWK